MTLEQQEDTRRFGNEEAQAAMRLHVYPHVQYLQKLSVLKDVTANPLVPFHSEEITQLVTTATIQEYALIKDAFGTGPEHASLYVNEGLYSHAISLEGDGVKTTTVRIQTPEQMLGAIAMIVDDTEENAEYSPFSFSALARTLKGIPVVNRVKGTEEEGVTEVYFRSPKGNERVDLYAFVQNLKKLADSGIGASTGFRCDVTNLGIKMIIPNNRLLKAETYRGIQPFQVGLGFSSKDGRYVRQYDVSTSVLSDAKDDQIFAMLYATEQKLIPAVHSINSIPEENRDILTLSGEHRNSIKELLRRFIYHERNTIRTKRDGFLDYANFFGKEPADMERLAALLSTQSEGSVLTANDIEEAANPIRHELLSFVLSRGKYFTLHEEGISLFEDAKDQIEELYPVHVGYGIVQALKRAHSQFQSLCGKKKLDYVGNDLKDLGVHPHYRTFINLTRLNGPEDVSIDEAVDAIDLPIEEVKRLLSSTELSTEESRILSIITSIHRAPVVAGFSSLFDIMTFAEYGNAIDINTGPPDNSIDFIASINPIDDNLALCTVENSGRNPSESVVDELNNPKTRANPISVSSDHGGSGEALALLENLSRLLNHSRDVALPMRFYAGYRAHNQKGFRVRMGLHRM